MTFSGADLPNHLILGIKDIVEDERFSINTKKTRLLLPGQKQIVTGLDISTGRPRAVREFRRTIEKEVYYIWKYGLNSHISNRKLYDPLYVYRLKGRIDFWESIKPNCARMNSAKARFLTSAKDFIR